MKKNSKVNITAIVAIDKNGGIGKNGDIPWKCKEDMQFFKTFTMGKTCVMGRRTFESIDRYNKKTEDIDLLPGRNIIVLTSKPPTKIERNKYKNLIFVDGGLMELQFHILNGNYGTEICIVGGASLYEEFAPYYNKVTITEFDADYYCSTYVDVNKLKFGKKIISKLLDVETDDRVKGEVTSYFIGI